MIRLFKIFILTSVLFMGYDIVMAQTGSDTGNSTFQITYDETRRRLFTSVDVQFAERWQLVETTVGDIPVIHVTRISGQVDLQLRLYNRAGDLLIESPATQFTDTAELVFDVGLSADDMPYQIEVVGTNAVDESINPVEYSLNVLTDGRRRQTIDEGITTLHERLIPNGADNTLSTLQVLSDVTPLDFTSTLQSDSQSILGFGVPVFGDLSSSSINNSVILQSTTGQTLTINQADATSNALEQIVLDTAGIGLATDNAGINFASDSSFAVTYSNITDNYTLTLDNGVVIRTTFDDVAFIQVVENNTLIQFENDNKRIITDSMSIDLQATDNAAIFNLTLDGETLSTNLNAWDTVAVIDGYVRVYSGLDSRFISDVLPQSITGSVVTASQQIILPVTRLNGVSESATLDISWARFDDVVVSDGLLYTVSRNGVISEEFLDEITNIETDDGAVRFARSDGTFRTVYPDGTDISTRATLADNDDLLPYETGFRTRNYNNLGDDIIPTCPCSHDVQSHIPVNPANGNFFYTVDDITTIGQPLSLNLTRYYNSHDSRYVNGISMSSRLTPRYMTNNENVVYPNFGSGWRHSFQYELDLSTEPLGRVTFIEPDGTGHYFFPSETDSNQWVSFTLVSARLFKEAGAFGTWRIETTSGETHYFDRVGRLSRLAYDNQSILLTKPSVNSNNANGSASMFIVDYHGRRLELTLNEQGLIVASRDITLSTPTEYIYTENTLTSVFYNGDRDRDASYSYSVVGLLETYDDVRSPYTQRGRITYYPDNRVENYFENPSDAGTLQREYLYIYPEFASDSEARTTNRIFQVGNERRVQSWTYNDLWQLINVQLPRDDWNYEFTYDINSGQLESVLVPTDVRFNLTFDDFGNLRRFEDPAFTGDSAYNFDYEQRGIRSLLTTIRYPNDQTETFVWSDDDVPKLLLHSTLITRTPNLTTRTRQFQYDDLGRLTLLVEADNSAIAYEYDARDYVSRLIEGIIVTSDGLNTDGVITTQLSYGLAGQIQSVRDNNDTLYSFNWDGTQLVGVTLNGESTLSYTYNERGLISSINDRGTTQAFQYNGLDLVETYLDERIGQTTYEYDQAGNVTRIIDATGEQTNFAYNALDQLIAKRLANGATSTYDINLDLDRNLILRSETDATGRVIVRRYDFLGRLTLFSIFAPTNLETPFQEFRFEYNSGAGQYLTGIVETRTGRVINLQYNLAGDVLAVALNDDETEFTYDEYGYLASVISPSGNTIRYAYDGVGNLTTLTLADNTQWQYDYVGNNLISAVNPRGETSQFIYDNLNRLISAVNPLGDVETYTYDARGNLQTIADANQPPTTTTYAYTVDDQIAQISVSLGADGNRTLSLLEYDALGQLNEITDARTLNTTRFTYDEVGNIIAINAGRQRTLYSYDALGRVISVTDPAGHTTSYEYDVLGQLIRTQDALGNSSSFNRAIGTNFIINYVDEAGLAYEITNDVLSQILSIRTLADERTTEFIYDDDGNITRLTTNFGQTHRYVYSSVGDITQYTDPLGGVWLFDYNAGQQLAQMTNPDGIITRYAYDDAGRIIAVTHASETDSEYIEQFTYDGNGNITSYEIPNVVRHIYTYNDLNLLGTATLAVDSEQSVQYLYRYDNSDKLDRIFTPDGRVFQFGYSLDDPDEIAQFIISDGRDDNNNLLTRYDYDIAGNLISVTTSGSEEDINLSYDSLDRRVRYVDSADNSWAYTYDATGNITQISDPLGSAVTYTYDSYDRVTSIIFPSGTEIDLNYDAATGTLASVVSPTGLPNDTIINYGYDAIGQLTSLGYNTVSAIRFQYDASGNIVRRIAPNGVSTTYEYDTLGQLRSTSYSDSSEPLIYDYDALGNRTQMGTITAEYDIFGRMTSITDNDSIRYQYNPVGQLESQESEQLGTQTAYTYDGLNRVDSITFAEQTIAVRYEQTTGLVNGYTRGNIETEIEYDENNRVREIAHLNNLAPDSPPIIVFTHSYDAVGNLIRVERVDDGNNTSEINYSYDIDQRLISERWLGADGETRYIVNYTYDAIGNRTEENRNGRVTTYTYNNQNQLIREQRNLSEDQFLMLPSLFIGLAGLFIIRRRRKLWILLPVISGLWVTVAFAQTSSQITLEYTYDVSSNLNSVRYVGQEDYILDYSYDNENRLIGVSGQILSFEDDGDEIGIDVDTSYVYDEMSRLIGICTMDTEYDLFYDGHTLTGIFDGETLERYLTFDGQQLMTITGEDNILWNLTDRQGSTWRFADTNATILDELDTQFEFGAFGTRIFPNSPDLAPRPGARVTRPTQFFTGQLYDPSTRLYLMGLRAYDPTTGRFIQPDPIRHDPNGSLYTYARNRPLNFIDPTGMMVEPLTNTIDLATVADNVTPEVIIPQPNTVEVTPQLTVAQQQSDEYFRALELVDATRFGVNTPIVELSPFYDDLYLFELNPIPEAINALRSESLAQAMSLYENNSSWQPDITPTPSQQNNPYLVLDDLIRKIAPATIEPLAFNLDQTPMMTILPTITLPTGIPEQTAIETQLIQQLQPIPLLPASVVESDTLLDTIPPEHAPMVSLPSVDLPQVVIEPAILTNLDDLREQTFQFYERIWSVNPSDCEDCVAPLGFNR
ncbi:MAG: RHS repeat-associated core domain-containing protein [Chloroflexota bacterium]